MNDKEKAALIQVREIINDLVGRAPVVVQTSVEKRIIPKGMVNPDIFLNLLEHNLKHGEMDDHSFVNLLRQTLPIVHFERSGKNKKGKL